MTEKIAQYECSEKERFGHIEEAIEMLKARNGKTILMIIGPISALLVGLMIFMLTNQMNILTQLARIDTNQRQVMHRLNLVP